MTAAWSGVAFVATLAGALCLANRPFGDYLVRVYTDSRHTRLERGVYRVIGADPRVEQRWPTYLRSVLAFALVGILFLYAFLRLQNHLPLGLGLPPMPADQSFNTAISFATNTNWQSYSGESTLGHLVQMAGLTVQNFLSAAVGLAVAAALVRGFARSRTDTLGNFWVDLTRGCLRILLPVSVVAALVMVAGGAIQNLHGTRTIATVVGGSQRLTGGPVASQEAIKELGTNGGGFYNANSAHPFENPTAWTNWIQVFLILLIPFSLPRMFGRMVGNSRQGLAIVAVMALLFVGSLAVSAGFQQAHHGTVPAAVTASSEGTETRLGVPQSSVFATATTATSTGAVDSAHDSYTSLGGAALLLNMALGEVAPGGVGSGLYGMLVLAVVAVFIAGLMIGRTPEYLQKKIGRREMTFAALYLLTTPVIVLVGAATALALPGERASMLNTGAHGLSEILYAFTSAGNNNGSAFAGLSANTTWYNTALGLAMLFSRFVPMVLVLGLAGSLAAQRPVPVSAGTLPTHRPQFVGMLAGVALVLVALTYFPALALGPLAEGIHR
jgi:potassium-transporting ATPase potassium-binding subunit